MIERGELSCRKRGRDEAGAMREHEVHALGDAGRMRDGKQRIGAGGMMRYEDAIKAGRS